MNRKTNIKKGFQVSAELMVYGLIAAGLVFWLRSILGTRHGDERDRSVTNLDLKESNVTNIHNGEAFEKSVEGAALIEELAKNAKGNMSIGSRTAEVSLVEIARVDRGFDIYAFLRAAQDAFVYIVESFAEGDRETLKDLLGKNVFAAFDKAITDRENAGEVAMTEIHAIKKSEVVEAHLEGKKARITVRFWADETSVVKDKDDEIIHGHPEKTTLMRDLWVFERDLKSRDPRWLVVETKEDEDDNELIPNSH